MAERQFEDGAEVLHKSGGPRMVVAGFGRYGMAATKDTYKCRWFDSKGEMHEDTFTEAELKAAPPASGGGFRVATVRRS